MSISPAHRFNNRPFYESATADELAALAPALRDKVLDFRRDGYLRFASGIDETTLDAAAQYVTDNCFHTIDGSRHLKEHRLADAWAQCDAIRDIALDANITSLLQTLYGRRPAPFQTLNFPTGSQQRTHSDGIHFNTVPSRFMCGVWVALEDIKPNSGPLHYYENSHRLPDTTVHETFDGSQQAGAYPALDDYNTCYEEYLQCTLEQEGLNKLEVCLNKGEAFIWSAGLCHGGSAVTDPDSTRLSQVTHVFFDDCLYFSPRRSHHHIGRLWLRDVFDISTRSRLPHTFAGHSVTLPGPGPYRIDSDGQLISDSAQSNEAPTTGFSSRLRRLARDLLPR